MYRRNHFSIHYIPYNSLYSIFQKQSNTIKRQREGLRFELIQREQKPKRTIDLIQRQSKRLLRYRIQRGR